MKISEVANKISPSYTRKLFNMAARFDDVIDFTLGDPDYMTPEHIRVAGCKAINEGKTKYSANAGLLKLRSAISKNIYQEDKVFYEPEKEIIVTVGAMEALFLSLFCMLDENDEVIIPAPFWVNYKHMVQMCGAKPVIVSAKEDNQFVVSADDIKKAITSDTKAIVINSPNNPTGKIYDTDTLRQICEMAIENDIVIFFDECYKKIVYDGNVAPSVLDFPDMKNHSVIINSFSKTFSMTGWRIGYAAAPEELISAMTKLQENLVSCAPLPSQYAAISALEHGSDETERMVQGFYNRRNLIVSGIKAIDKLDCIMPQGTFYAFINIKETGFSCVDFAYRLLEEMHVAVVPGITYGDCCEGYVRLAYTMDEAKIKIGLDRIRKFIENFC